MLFSLMLARTHQCSTNPALPFSLQEGFYYTLKFNSCGNIHILCSFFCQFCTHPFPVGCQPHRPKVTGPCCPLNAGGSFAMSPLSF